MNPHNLVDALVHCPQCGERVGMLYTEDATREVLRYETVPIEAVHSFYGQCDRCDTWLVFERRQEQSGTRVSDFTLTWDPDRPRLVSRRGFFSRCFRR